MMHCERTVRDSNLGTAGPVAHSRAHVPIHGPIHRRTGHL